ncbi:MAG TPA: alpha/beta fold hydrolase [Solirubrobacterales bacterium]|nr:alpha/beta fold hydrolase [Solirubrobacterales bacterium]
MGRGWKIAIGAVAALVVLLGANVLLVDGETKSAGLTAPEGRIVDLAGGDLQVVEGGPRGGDPIVLVHCFTCSLNWWDRLRPRLERDHRVISADLLGHGGSEKPDGGYSIENQAELLAEVLERRGVRDAEVVGHSLGGPVSIALAEQHPELVDRLVAIDSVPDRSYGDVGFIGELPFKPVLGQFLWRVKPDFSIRDGLEVAFAPGFEVPDAFVEDVKEMTYSSYAGSHDAFADYTDEKPLPERAAATGKPLLAIMGAEEQIAEDPRESLDAYLAGYPESRVKLIAGAGHSPNVEKPAETANLILGFAKLPPGDVRSPSRDAAERGGQPQQSSSATSP